VWEQWAIAGAAVTALGIAIKTLGEVVLKRGDDSDHAEIMIVLGRVDNLLLTLGTGMEELVRVHRDGDSIISNKHVLDKMAAKELEDVRFRAKLMAVLGRQDWWRPYATLLPAWLP
jgi:hypothetical protein